MTCYSCEKEIDTIDVGAHRKPTNAPPNICAETVLQTN